eukprot:SM000118S25587  [mRNA]  locus=s118:92915:96504:- [translate_table: standard]
MVGRTRLALVSDGAHYRGACAYEFPFHIAVPGEYRVSIQLLYVNYDGVQETLDYWPPLLNIPVIEDWLLEICPVVYKSAFAGGPAKFNELLNEFVARQARHMTAQYFPDPLLPALQAIDGGRQPALDESSLPACDAILPAPGVWLRLPEGVAQGRGGDDLVDFALGKYIWLSFNCRTTVHSPQSLSSCRSKDLNLTFVGDSHVRVAVCTLRDYLRSTPVGSINFDFSKVRERRDAIGPFKLHFLWDPYFSFVRMPTMPPGTPSTSSTSALATTLHQLPTGRPNVTAAVKRLTDVRAARELAHPDRPLKIIFHGLPCAPGFRTDDFVVRYKDWRTVNRMQYWNSLTREIMTANHIAVINSFEISLPMLRTSRDLAHYIRNDAGNAMLAETMHKIGLCDVSES